MSIHSITIKKTGQSYVLSSPFIVAADTGVRLPVAARVVTVGTASPATFFDDAEAVVVSSRRYVSTINGNTAKDDGHFWFNVDRCLSWVELSEEGSALPGLRLIDLCPACTDCRTVSELRQRVEDIHIMLNTLKDVNLYDDRSNGAVAYLATKRREFLEASRGAVSQACATGYDRLDMSYLKARQLLWNYVTMVHMWNYVVTHLNTRTHISIAPEDDSGFVVQIMRAVPSCDGSTTVNASVAVSPAVSTQEGLSMLVLAKTDFKPFKPDSSEAAGAYEGRFSIAQPADRPTSKTVTTNFGPSTISGVYMLEVKFLPFRKVTLLNEDGDSVSFDSSDLFNGWDESDTPDGGTKWQTNTSLGVAESVIAAPTVDDYNTARTFPSKTVYGTNTWQIVITWTTTTSQAGQTASVPETYMFQTNKVRSYEPRVLADEVFTEPPNSSDSGTDPGHGGDDSDADTSDWWSDASL